MLNHLQSETTENRNKLIKISQSYVFIILVLYSLFTIVSTPCFELSDDDFESESNELELACFDAEL